MIHQRGMLDAGGSHEFYSAALFILFIEGDIKKTKLERMYDVVFLGAT